MQLVGCIGRLVYRSFNQEKAILRHWVPFSWQVRGAFCVKKSNTAVLPPSLALS